MLEKFRSIFGFERRSLAFPSPELLALFGAAGTTAGVSVSAASALTSPTTLACVRAIADAVGSLPVHLFRRMPDNTRARDTASPVAGLLAGDWAPWAGGVETRVAMQLDALLHGAAYGQVVRLNGVPKEVHRLDPTAVSIDWSAGEPAFKYSSAGRQQTLQWQDVVYVPTPGSSPSRPLCLLSSCREAIAVDMAMARYQANLMGRGARPSGVLQTDKTLSANAVDRLKSSLEQSHAGGQSGKTIVLEEGMKFEALQFSSVDLQFLELRKFAIAEIARAFKVPPTLVGDIERGTWRNIEELGRQFVTFTLLPWIEVWSASLARVLLSPEDRANSFLEFQVDDLMRGDLAGRFVAYRNAVGGAWLTPNDVRRFDNLAPIEGGDKLILQAGQSGAAPAAGAPA